MRVSVGKAGIGRLFPFQVSKILEELQASVVPPFAPLRRAGTCSGGHLGGLQPGPRMIASFVDIESITVVRRWHQGERIVLSCLAPNDRDQWAAT